MPVALEQRSRAAMAAKEGIGEPSSPYVWSREPRRQDLSLLAKISKLVHWAYHTLQRNMAGIAVSQGHGSHDEYLC